MQPRKVEWKRGNAQDWTKERIEQMGRDDVRQLQANAERLGEAAIAALCCDVLKTMPARAGAAAVGKGKTGKGGQAGKAAPGAARGLTSRTKALQARGVWVQDVRSSWSGVRKEDGVVVMMLWAAAVQSSGGGCSCLLWAPNVGGARPWSDSAAGKERLEHCKLAASQGGAEGLLAHGEPLEGHLPEDRARTVHGVDPRVVLALKVEKRGSEYWALWGGKTAA